MEEENKNIESNKSSFETFLKQLINGSVLTKQILRKHLLYILFLVGLSMIHIYNIYKKDDLIIEISETQREIKKLRSKSVVNASRLMIINRESVVNKLIKEKKLELKALENPANEIYYKK